MDKPRPYVSALLCEKILQEKDESLTLVRVADRLQYRIEGKGLPEGIKPMIAINGLVSLKAGPVVGDHTVKIVGEKPNGERKELHSMSVNLMGKEHVTNIILNMGIGIDQDGLYWFDVVFDDEVLTRMPLLVTPAQMPSAEKPLQPEQKPGAQKT